MKTNDDIKIKDIIIVVFGIIVFSFYPIIAINQSSKNIKINCIELKLQSETCSDFHIAEWQKNQCGSVGIFINAPIK